VEEHEKLPGGGPGAGVHLPGAAGGAGQVPDAGMAPDHLDGGVPAAPVDHDHLGFRPAPRQIRQEPLEIVRLVEGGNDDDDGGDGHASAVTPVMASLPAGHR
jgi:hypothetical protein